LPRLHSFPTRRSSDLFLLAGDDLAARLAASCLLAPDQKLARLDVVQLAAAPPHESALAGALQVSRRFLGLITRGREAAPEFDQRSEEHTSELQSRRDL